MRDASRRDRSAHLVSWQGTISGGDQGLDQNGRPSARHRDASRETGTPGPWRARLSQTATGRTMDGVEDDRAFAAPARTAAAREQQHARLKAKRRRSGPVRGGVRTAARLRLQRIGPRRRCSRGHSLLSFVYSGVGGWRADVGASCRRSRSTATLTASGRTTTPTVVRCRSGGSPRWTSRSTDSTARTGVVSRKGAAPSPRFLDIAGLRAGR